MKNSKKVNEGIQRLRLVENRIASVTLSDVVIDHALLDRLRGYEREELERLREQVFNEESQEYRKAGAK